MNTTLAALKIVGIAFGTAASIYCGYVAVKLWQWKSPRRAAVIAFLAVANLGMVAFNASYFFRHGTADAKAPVAAKRELDLEVVPGPADTKQKSSPVQP